MPINKIRKSIVLDIAAPVGMESVLYMGQHDHKAREAEITLTGDGSPYIIPGDGSVSAKIFCDKPDGHNVFNDATIVNGKVVVIFTDQMLAAAGAMPCRISLFGTNGERLTSADFIVMVRANKAEDGVLSSNEFEALIKALANIDQIKKDTLSYKQQAEAAQNMANESAAAAAASAKTASGNADKTTTDRSASETAAKRAETAKIDTEAARDTATASATTAAENAAQTVTNKTASETAANRAEAAKVGIETARDIATGAANTATTQAQQAQLEAQKVQKIAATNEAYTKDQIDLEYAHAPRGEATGKGSIELSDSDRGKAYVELEGASEQYQNVASKNLIDLHFILDGHHIEANGAIVKYDQSFASSFIPVKPNTKYYLSGTFTTLPLVEYDSSKNYITGYETALVLEYGFTTKQNTRYIRTSASKTVLNTIQLEEGTTATAYVPGAVETPSPEYPSEVKSVGDIPKDVNGVEIRNLLDEHLEDSLIYEDSKDFIYLKLSGDVITGNYAAWSKKTPVSNDLYCRFSKTIIGWGDAGSIQIVAQGVYNGEEGTRYPCNFLNSSDLYITFTHASTSGNKKPSKEIIKQFFETYNIMLTTAAEIDEYRPYIGANNGLVKLETAGKNLIDINFFRGRNPTVIIDENKVTFGSMSYIAGHNILKTKPKENTQYTLSFYAQQTGVSNIWLFIGHTDGSNARAAFTQQHIKITSLPNKTVKGVYVSYSFVEPTLSCSLWDLQLEEGTAATRYQPYQYKTTWVTLKEPLRAIGDCKDTVDREGGVVQRIVKEQFSDVKNSLTKNENGKEFYLYYISPYGLANKVAKGSNILCNILKYKENYVERGKNGLFISTLGSSEIIYINIGKELKDETENTVDFVIQILLNNNMDFTYVLLNPITYQIQAIHIETYDPITNARCLSKVTPNMKLDYKKSLTKILSDLQNAVLALGGN